MNWRTVQIKDICKKVTSGGTPLTSKENYYFPRQIPWVKTKEVNYCRITDAETYISQEGLDNSSAKLIPANSVIVAMYGQGDTAGRVAINKIPVATNQACCNLIIDETKADYRFIYYKLSNMYEKLVSLKNGGAQPNLNAAIIKNLEVNIPNLEIQHNIADILSAYDDLIENNQKQIKLLEEAAQRLYKEWFVDLRFPGYENTPIIDGIPQGWEKVSLGELIEYEIGGGWGEDQPTEKCDLPAYVIRGTDLYDVTHGNSKGIPYRFHSKSNLESRKLQDGDVVFEVSGGSKNEGVARTALITESLLDFLGGDVICASFCKLIRFKDKSSAKYMYDTFQHLRNSGETVKYDKRSASSIVNYRWKDFLDQQLVFVPTDDVLKRYNDLAENMQKAIVKKAQIIEQAKQARDRLLPKLMSGELEV